MSDGGPRADHQYLTPIADLSGDRAVIFYDRLGGGYHVLGPYMAAAGDFLRRHD